MALKIVTGGTTGAADGTLVDGSNPIVFTAIDTPVDAHIRADDDTYAAPAQFIAATTAGPAVGKGDIQVSVDGGSTWKSWSDNPYSLATGVGAGPDLGDLNFPIKLRQHAASPPGDTSGSFDTDGTLAAATALSDVGSFAAASASSTSIAVSWAAVTNRTRYQVDRATNSGFTTGVTLGVYTGTGTSFTDTGLTTGTTYYYRIKAVGTYRYKDSANWATANAVAANPIFASDDFNTGSGDLVGNAPVVGGNWTDGSESGTNSPVYSSNRIRQQDAATTFTYVATTPASADYYVQADVIPQSAGSGGVAGVIGRKVAATGTGNLTMYWADYYDHATAGSRQWRLVKYLAGSVTVLGTYTENIGTTSTTLKLEMIGTAIKVYVNGTQRISATDSDITAAGRAGVVVGGASSNTNGPWLDNFVASL